MLAEIRVVASLVLGLLTLACGSARDEIGVQIPVIEVEPVEVVFSWVSLAEGESGAAAVTIRNSGTRELIVSAITLDYTPPEGSVEEILAIRLGEDLPALPAVVGVTGSGESEVVVVPLALTRMPDGVARAAALHIASDDPNLPDLAVPIWTTLPLPRLRVTPEALDLGAVTQGQHASRSAIVRNSGSEDLVVDGLRFAADTPGFSLAFATQAFAPLAGEAAQALDPPLVLAPDEAASLEVGYLASRPDPASAQVLFFSNDPTWPEGFPIKVVANQAGGCIEVTPHEVAFSGVVPPGQAKLPFTIANCSPDEPLHVTGLALADADASGCAGAFCLLRPGPWAPDAGTPETPLVIEPDESASAFVVYAPTAESEVDPQTGEIQKDRGTLVVRSDAFTPEVEVPLSGFGLSSECPVPVITIDEGGEVAPQTKLHLHGEASYSSGVAVSKYVWSVTQPPLSTSVFVPTDSFPSPTFEANVAGTYVFRLDVVDEYERPSCAPAEATVEVIPGEGIHVELLWTTAGDPDATDEGKGSGADLDLHFAHPNASSGYDLDLDGVKDPWFDEAWDVFFIYPTQEWGAPGGADNPTLDRDDVDGFGPENINLRQPEQGRQYAFGVNYWNDYGFGPSLATVRVYVYGILRFERKDVPMSDHDMCWIGTVDWPSGAVSPKLRADGSVWCTHDYHHPTYYQP